MRKKIIAANWKMNMTVAETESYLENFRSHVETVNGVEIVIAPPFTAIAKLSELLGGSQKISLGAQNMSSEMSGAFTGEISPQLGDRILHFGEIQSRHGQSSHNSYN